jgi:hypothetical protein
MKRDKQIFVRVTQDVYDWVAAQSDATGMSHGGVAARVLQEARDRGWTITPGVVRDGEPGGGDER